MTRVEIFLEKSCCWGLDVMKMLLVLLLAVFFKSQIINVVPNGEGHGSLIVCPNGDSIIYNFRKMAQYEPPEGYYEYILDEAYPQWRERTTNIIISGPEQTKEITQILRAIRPNSKLEKLYLQGKREYYKSSKGLHETTDDMIDYLVENYPFLDYQFYDDEDYFKKFDFCDDPGIEFVLMNVKTQELPKLSYYRRNIHRGWSLRIKNFYSKKSMTFIQDIESIEQKNLHTMMKQFHEKEKTYILQLSHYNHADHTETNLFKQIKPKMIISQNGCPKTTNVYTPKCEVFEKALKSKSLAIVEPHSILCSRFEKRIQLKNFNRAIFSTVPSEDWLNLIRYDLSNLTYDIIPIFYNDDEKFKHPCSGYHSHQGYHEIDGVVNFLKYMKDASYMDVLDEERMKKEYEEQQKEINEKELILDDDDDNDDDIDIEKEEEVLDEL